MFEVAAVVVVVVVVVVLSLTGEVVYVTFGASGSVFSRKAVQVKSEPFANSSRPKPEMP